MRQQRWSRGASRGYRCLLSWPVQERVNTGRANILAYARGPSSSAVHQRIRWQVLVQHLVSLGGASDRQ